MKALRRSLFLFYFLNELVILIVMRWMIHRKHQTYPYVIYWALEKVRATYIYVCRPHLFQCPIYTYRYVWCFLWTIHLITIRITSSLRKKNRNNDLPRAFMSMVNYIVLSKLIHFELPGKISCNIWRLFYDLQTYLDIIQYDLQNKIFELSCGIYFSSKAYEIIRNHFKQNYLVTAKHLSALMVKSLRVARTL